MRHPTIYTGKNGQHYQEQRKASQSDYVQSLRASLFRDLAGGGLVILDFGCGTGGVLKRLPAARRIGVEIGEWAAEAALKEIVRVVKPGGCIRIIVPSDFPLLRGQRSWFLNHDRHLFTWTPLLLGNLADRAGLQNIKARSEPMPTGSRLVRMLSFLPALARLAHLILSLRRNSLNVILDARPAVTSRKEMA